MEPGFNIDRPRISDEEIDKHKDFNQLVKQFKQQSLQKARLDKSWWKSKKVRYSTIIAGITVICTISYFAIFKNETNKNNTNETLTTQNNNNTNNKEQGTNKQGTKIAFVNAPSKKLTVPYTKYKVENSKGGEISHGSSSRIKIPKNSFTDKNGKDVIGDVTIEYREFHDHGDVIVSGIPMAYDSAGKKYNLESAGMFDIIGHQNGEPVFIKPDKNLEVELASTNDENRFNQYYLDTVERNWKYIKKDILIKEKNKKSAIKSEKSENLASSGHLERSREAKIENLKSQIESILPKKIDSVKVAYTKKVEILPKGKEPAKPAKPSGRQTFNIDASSDDFPELSSFGNLLFEIGLENKNYTKEMNDITWNDVKISEGPQKGKNYLLTLTYRQRVEKFVVYPVLTGNDFDKAQKRYEQKFIEYQGLLTKREADEKRLIAEMEAKQKAYLAEIEKKKAELENERSLLVAKREAAATAELANNFGKLSNQVKAKRIFEVSRFGIHNSDCPQSAPRGMSLKPTFALNGQSGTLFPDVIYLIDHGRNTVYNFYQDKFNQIVYNPFAENTFVIFVNDKVYLCNKNTFKENADSKTNIFTVSPLPVDADNYFDFKKALDI